MQSHVELTIAYNWSRTAATSQTMISTGQHTGLAAQVASGDVEYAFLGIGTNNFRLDGLYGVYQDVYDGTLSGAALTTYINQCIGNVTDALDALIAEGILGIVCQLFPVIPEENQIAYGYTDSTSRQRYFDTVNAINSGINSACTTRGIPTFVFFQIFTDMGVTGTFGSRTADVCGETIQIDSIGDEPHNAILADTHLGTVVNGFFANLILDKLINYYGLSLTLLSECEMTALAGM